MTIPSDPLAVLLLALIAAGYQADKRWTAWHAARERLRGSVGLDLREARRQGIA